MIEKTEANKQFLIKVFEENIDLFGKFVFNKYITSEIPAFHLEIYETITSEAQMIGIAAPRGHAKSTIVDMIFAAWNIAYKKKHHIIILSDSYTQSEEFVNTLKSELEHNEVFNWLYSDLMSDKWSSGEFETATGIKVSAKGLGMKIRGLKYRQYRPDLIIIDDLENDEAVSSITQRKKLKNYVLRGVIPALAVDGQLIMIGTILHQDSLLKKIIDKREEFGGWTVKKYQALTYSATGEVIESLWPGVWPTDKLLRMKNDSTFEKYLGSIVFEQEYQNNPRSIEDTLINPDWIKFYEILPEGLERVMAVDPAISKKDTADPSAIEVWGKRTVNGFTDYYCLNATNKRLNFPELQREIRMLDTRFSPTVVLVETTAYQEALRQSLEGLPTKGINPDKDKVRRLLKVQPLFEGGHVYLRRDQIELFDQLTTFTGVGDEHDDLVDACAYALTHLQGSRFSFAFGDSVFNKDAEYNGLSVDALRTLKPQEIKLVDEEERKKQEKQLDLQIMKEDLNSYRE